ncbi:tyrosine-type recombinase/integrase [Paenibacillus crassostreae]
MTISMELRGFAKSTQRMYLAHMKRFYLFCGKPPASVGYDEVRAFLHHAIKTKKLSSAYVNSAYGAIKFFYQSVLFREWNMLHIPRVKKKFFLPTILTFQEVCQILDATRNLKHKTIYSAGLRVSEVAHLQLTDIHSSDMRLLVRQTKGGKDRYSILSNHNLLLLRQYWKAYRSSPWLFPGVPDTKPISVRSIQSIFKDSLHASGISKDVSVHTLRHCFATHLLNRGSSILQIKEFLGHADIQTTTMYLHLTHAQVASRPFSLSKLVELQHWVGMSTNVILAKI